MDIKQKLINAIRAVFDETPEELRALSTSNLYDQIYPLIQAVNPMGYLCIHDIFHAEEGMSVVWSDRGILFSAPVNVDGDDIVSLGEVNQVKQEFVPVGRTVLRQQEDGQWRWLSRSAVSVLNRVGEIDSTALFDSFIEHACETDEWPTRQFFHKTGDAFTVGQTDWVGREGNVLLTSGLYNDSKLAQAEVKARQAAASEWGDSIRFEPVGADSLELLEVADGVIVPVYRSGRLIEISTVPERDAASWFTSGVVRETNSMKDNEFAGLVKLFFDDEDKARAWLEENAGELNRQIEEAGLVARSTAEGEASETVPAPLEIDDSVIRAITDAALESEAFTVQRDGLAAQADAVDALTAKLDELAQLITAQQATIDLLTADDDAKRARYAEDLPPQRQQVIHRPSVTHRAQSKNGDQRQQTHSERAEQTLAEKGVQ